MVGRVTAFAHQADTVGLLDSSRSFSGQTCFERQIGHVDVFNAVLQVAGEFEQAVQVQIETGVEVGLTRQTRNHLCPIGFGGIVLQQQLQGGHIGGAECIYTRLGWPSRNGGLERAFIHWAQADTQVLGFCKISENRHTFARLRYVKDDGLPAFYSPDFLVRTAGAVYLVETKGQEQTIHPNVQRKLKAALAWCERINNLTEEQRYQVFEGNARRVFSRLDTRLKAKGL